MPLLKRAFTNGSSNDHVINAVTGLAASSSRADLAAPYFTERGSSVVEGLIADGKNVRLLVGLNAATDPDALKRLRRDVPELTVRYLTSAFHAKVFLFDDSALIGSANLTTGGLLTNREAVVSLEHPDDADALDEVRALFAELWEAGAVLTQQTLGTFAEAHATLPESIESLDRRVEDAVGKVEPPNVDVDSRNRPRRQIYIEELRRDVASYQPAFAEVARILETNNLRRSDLRQLGLAHETNRFLNYVRTVHAIGDDAWQRAPLRVAAERRPVILGLGRKWVEAADNKVPEDYAVRLDCVRRVFRTRGTIESSTKEALTEGLMSLHAFTEQSRFVKGGWNDLPRVFWRNNDDDVARVKSELGNLVHGGGDFVERLHDLLFLPSARVAQIGRFCALELYGTTNPEEFPPINGRMAKALRHLGFDVKGV